MSTILQPAAQLVVPGVIDTPDRPVQGRASLDFTRAPYAQAEVTIPITDADLPLIEGLDSRRETRGTLTASELISGTSRVFDLAVQSRRVSQDGRSMTIGLGGDETLLQQYYPLTEDRTPLNYQDSLRGICNYVLRTVIALRRNIATNPAGTTTTKFLASVPGGAISIAGGGAASTPAGVPSTRVRAEVTAAGTDRIDVIYTENVTQRVTYSISAWAAFQGVGTATQLILQWRDSGGNVIRTDMATPTPIAPSVWGRVELAGVVAPGGADTVRLYIRRPAATVPVGAVGFVTGILIEPNSPSVRPYFDGDTPNGDGFQTFWVGAPNASPTRMSPRLKASPSVDANSSAYWTVTNLLTEPSHEGALGWVAGSNATPLGGASPARSGMYAARWFSQAAGGTWMDTAGPIRVSPGRKYTVSTYMRSTSSIQGRFLVRFKNDAGVTLQLTFSPSKLLTPDYQRFVYTVTPPPGATQAMLHIGAIATAASQPVWNDDVMFYEGEEEIDFFDGNTPNSSTYTYSWSGTPQASTSTRVPVVERPLETFYWRPSTSAWNFLMALVGSFGFMLFCDEKRQWFLIDPNTYVLPGTVSVGPTNAVTANDTIDRNDDAYCTGVSILWKWQDRWGIDQERNETAGVAGSVRYLELNRPFPGPGLAAAMLARASGRGRVHEVNALTDLAATPVMSFAATFPGVSPQRARVSAVEWDLGSGLMRVTGRTGNSVPDAPAAPTVTSPVAGRLVVSWSPPADDGGFPILEYRISVQEGSGGANIDGAVSPSTTNGWGAGAKQVSVAARNVYGWGPFSPSTPITVS